MKVCSEKVKLFQQYCSDIIKGGGSRQDIVGRQFNVFSKRYGRQMNFEATLCAYLGKD